MKGNISMQEAIILFLSIVLIIISLKFLYSMPSDFLKEFEKSCKEEIKRRDEEFERKEKTNENLRKWLFDNK
jgi:hypothetical protein